ncbi:MAG TPA: hypothetical protein VNX01_01860 [Bacteroidia bacterium]|nr:hypothetical protein [Bacteroidia bacterium]
MSDFSNTSLKSKKGGFFKKLLLGLVIIFIIVFGFIYLATKLTYSEGDRAGTISKFSKKGFIFKTYEGELNVGAQGQVGNMQNNLWEFSVNGIDNVEDLAKVLQDAMLSGKRVRLHYKQPYTKFFWMGDTEYFVTEIQEAK